MGHLQNEAEFRVFVKTIGSWFEGMAKFVAIMARHNDSIYTGERLMLQKLEAETFKIDKYMKALKKRFKLEDYELTAQIIQTVQERMLDDGRVGEALTMPAPEFLQQLLTDEERQSLNSIIGADTLIECCLYEPLRSLFGLSGSAHRLNSLNDGSISSRLFVAAINDGAVTVVIDDSSAPIVMGGITAGIDDTFSLAGLVDTDVSCIVNIGGFQIEFGAGNEQ
jgi:hypothetical protein